MLALTSFERAVRRSLIDRTRNANGDRERTLMTYGQLGEFLRPVRREGDPTLEWPFGGFFEALGHVSMYEVEHGRPMLSAIVVNAETGSPGDGFEKLARHLGFDVVDGTEFWEDEVEEVLDTWGRH